jgi:hypothetical protein
MKRGEPRESAPTGSLRNHIACWGFLALGLAFSHTAQSGQIDATVPHQVPPAGRNKREPGASLPALPPLPQGVSELKFCDFFVQPMGRHGLEFTDGMRSLDAQRVRILGFMVKQDTAPTGMFLLAAMPVELHESEKDCFIDNLPPNVVLVLMPVPAKPVPYTPGLMLLTGKLSLGNRLEADGRMSSVRLVLEKPEGIAKMHSSPEAKGAERLTRTAEPPGDASR